MTVRKTSASPGGGEGHKVLNAGGPYDLTTQGGGLPDRCARRITVLTAGNITSLKESGDIDAALGAVPQGMVLEGHYSSVTTSGGAVLYVQW